MECIQKWLCLLSIVLYWESRVISVLSLTDGILTCPAVWKDQDTVNLTCEVLASSVNSTACPGASGKLSFNFVSGPTLTPDCFISSYLDAACNKTSYGKGCKCLEKTSNDTYILVYTLTVDVARHMGVSWACAPVCEDINNRKVSLNITTVDCTNVTIETTTPTMPTTTVRTAVTTAIPESTSEAVTTTVTKSTSEGNVTQYNSTCPDIDILCDKWKIIIIVILPIVFVAAVAAVVAVVVCGCKGFQCFESKAVDLTHPSNERHQNNLESGKPDAPSASAPPDESSLKKSDKKEHITREETPSDLTELQSGSATSEKSASNTVPQSQSRPLPVPKFPPVQRNSSVDPFHQDPLPEISARSKH